MRPSSSCTARPKSAARSVREPLGATPVVSRVPLPWRRSTTPRSDSSAYAATTVPRPIWARVRARARAAGACRPRAPRGGRSPGSRRRGRGSEGRGATPSLPSGSGGVLRSAIGSWIGSSRDQRQGKDATHEPFTQHLVAEARPGGTQPAAGRRPSPSVARTPTTRRRWPGWPPSTPTRSSSGDVIVAEVAGDIWAAAEIDGAWVLADPFRPSGELALTVAQRAGDLRVAAKRAARREERRARAAAKAAKAAKAAVAA